jgi:hypothetical protein
MLSDGARAGAARPLSKEAAPCTTRIPANPARAARACGAASAAPVTLSPQRRHPCGTDGAKRTTKPFQHYGTGGSQSAGRGTVARTRVSTAGRSPWEAEPVAWSKDTWPPENDARTKDISPLEKEQHNQPVEDTARDQDRGYEGHGQGPTDLPQPQLPVIRDGPRPSVGCHEDGDRARRSAVAVGPREVRWGS